MSRPARSGSRKLGLVHDPPLPVLSESGMMGWVCCRQPRVQGEFRSVNEEKFRVKWTLLGVAIGFLWVGPVAGFVVALSVPPEASFTWAMVAWAIATIGIPAIFWQGEMSRVSGVRARRQRERRAQAERDRIAAETARQQAAAAKQRAIQDRADRRANLASSLLTNANSAVSSMEQMPRILARAQARLKKAQAFYADGAFSPFWSAIEESYAALEQYISAADAIRDSASKHATLVKQIVALGGDPKGITDFPIRLDEAGLRSSYSETLQALDAQVLTAQKQVAFAQIWEQRRTTAAVIQGFANLEQAVSRMNSRLDASMRSLGGAIERSRDDVTSSLQILQTTLAAPAPVAAPAVAPVAASNDQVAQMRQLVSHADSIRRELFLQGHGRYPFV